MTRLLRHSRNKPASCSPSCVHTNITVTVWTTHNEFPVLCLQSLVALPQLVGHQLVLVSLLLTGVQLLGQNEQRLLLTLQLALAHQELRGTQRAHRERTESGGVMRGLGVLTPGAAGLSPLYRLHPSSVLWAFLAQFRGACLWTMSMIFRLYAVVDY